MDPGCDDDGNDHDDDQGAGYGDNRSCDGRRPDSKVNDHGKELELVENQRHHESKASRGMKKQETERREIREIHEKLLSDLYVRKEKGAAAKDLEWNWN